MYSGDVQDHYYQFRIHNGPYGQHTSRRFVFLKQYAHVKLGNGKSSPSRLVFKARSLLAIHARVSSKTTKIKLRSGTDTLKTLTPRSYTTIRETFQEFQQVISKLLDITFIIYEAHEC